MAKINNYEELLKKVKKVTKEKKLDLSSGEDLSIAVMNLISIEEHLFFTSQKTQKPQYLTILNEVRSIRTELLKRIIKDYEGEVWCISKHLLASSMRVMEVGTKELKKGNKRQAWGLFEKAYQLYNLFWAINLDVVKIGDVAMEKDEINFFDEKNGLKATTSPLTKLGAIFKKAIDCCRE